MQSIFTSLPFGEPNYTSGSDLDPGHFGGLDLDGSFSATSLGLHHATFREYNSTLGRWMSPDSYGGSYDPENPQSMNRYSYVLNNPLSYTDLSGLECQINPADGATVDDGGGCKAVDDANAKDLRDGNYSATVNGDALDWIIAKFGSLTSLYGQVSSSSFSAPNGGGTSPTSISPPAPNKPSCVNANFAQRAVVSVLSKVAQLTGRTVGYGVGGSIGVGKAPLGVTLSASQQLLVSPDGTAGLATSFTPLPFSLSTTGVGGLAGVQITGNRNKTFMDNGGVGLDAGAMFADEIGGGADVSNSGFTFTGGVGFGGYGHGGTATYTVATPFCPS